LNETEIYRLASWLKDSFNDFDPYLATPERNYVAQKLVGENPDRDKRLQKLLELVANPEHVHKVSTFLSEPRQGRFLLSRRALKPILPPDEIHDFARHLREETIDDAVRVLKKESRSAARRETVRGALEFLGINTP
jgi:hypothetical protein